MADNARMERTFSVRWSAEDGEWVGLCAEFPSLSHLDATEDAALRGIMALVESAIDTPATPGEKA